MIAVIDYQAGNGTSVLRALRSLGHKAEITSDPEEVKQAERVIFPGVGAAGAAMDSLRQLELITVLRQVIERQTPFLGICLGYQLLFERSLEDNTECLGVLPGEVVGFPAGMRESESGQALKIPHMGWNRVDGTAAPRLWQGIEEDTEFYFVHSYYPDIPERSQRELACMYTDYGVDFVSGVHDGNLVGVQFHPEKSGRPGLALLDNFCRS